MTLSDEQMAKLPKWAQREFKLLQRRYEEAVQAHSDTVERFGQTSEARTRIAVDPMADLIGSGARHAWWIDDTRTVRFYVGDDPPGEMGSSRGYVDAGLTVERPGAPLAVELMGSGQVVVEPKVTNRVLVYLTERDR